MRIAHCIRALIAVLGLAAVVQPVASNEYFNDTFYDFHRIRRSPRRKHFQEDRPLQNILFESKPMQNRINKKNHQESEFFSSNETIDCCPMVEEMVEPMGGSNQDGLYVELYRDENYRQRFYELSCDLNVVDKPCKFIQKKLHNMSRCVQKHSYTYALVKDTPTHRTKNYPLFPTHDSSGSTYTLDYIRVRSGCSCEVMTNHNSKKNSNKKKRKKVHHKT